MSPAAPTASSEFSVSGKEFHFQEYVTLKTEVAGLVEHSRKLEIYTVGGMAAFYAWFVTALSCEHLSRYILCIPVLIAVLGGFRSWAVLTRIGEISAYIEKVESVFALRDKGLLGWETELRAKASGPFASTATVFWVLLVAASVAAGAVLPRSHC